MRVTILGAGGSSGTPAIGGDWGRCDPANPRNRRTRPSILVEEGSTRLLIDTSPDLRAQLLAAGVSRLTAVLYTHAHADHLHGIDDLRGVNRAMAAPLPIYASRHTLSEIRRRFGYVLEPLEAGATIYYRPCLIPHEIADGSRFTVGGIEVCAFDQDHGFSRTLGFRFGDVAYSTDLMDLPEPAFAVLAGVRLWIIGVFTDQPHASHAHVEKALSWITRVGPERAVLSHLGNPLDYDRLCRELPAHVRPAYDGMTLERAHGFAAIDDAGRTTPHPPRLVAKG
jgi:phosphoribosyl 1,2-cyclic phosphate phosphodiesterase